MQYMTTGITSRINGYVPRPVLYGNTAVILTYNYVQHYAYIHVKKDDAILPSTEDSTFPVKYTVCITKYNTFPR